MNDTAAHSSDSADPIAVRPSAAPTDSPEQARVVNAPADDTVLVVAGAGSGKTYTMTRRIINLIAQGVPPERILGLTFTRKAASELLARVSAAVVAGDGTGDHAGVGTAARRAFLKPEVATYDAFFQSIVRQYGLLVGFDQNTQPLSEAGAMQLASTVIDRHMDTLFAYDFGSFASVVRQVLGLSHAIGNAMIGGGIVTVDQAIARIRAWDADFLRQLDTAIGDQLVPESEPAPKPPRRLKKDTDRQYAAKCEDYRAALHDLCVYRCAALRDVTRRREILLTLVEDYEHEKRRQNMAEFSDFTLAAYRLVSQFPSIGERYRRRYTHVLLDEYQDTSTTQAMLLAALFHPDTGHGAAVNAVGDPFQSIYAWRGASPGAFRMFQRDFDMGKDARPFPLSVTRRNARIVLAAANDLTKPLRITPRRPGSSLMHEVGVTELTALPTAPEGTLGVLGLTTFGQEVDAVARFAKRAIARYTPGGAEAVVDASAKDVRPHVAVLFRGGKERMADFAQGLEQAGLTTMVVGYSALLDRPEVRDLLALLHAVADHTDTNALMRLLATPRFGLRGADLAALADLADRLDTQYRYRALVEAGVIEGCAASGGVSDLTDAERERRARIVKEYRDQVPHAVFLADLLARKDFPDLLADDPAFGAAAAAGLTRAGAMIRQVQAVANHPLATVIDTAVQALDLDIDLVVAQAINHPDRPVNPTRARGALDSVAALVTTYTQEIVEGQNPTLRGFVGWVDSLKQIEEETPEAPDTPVDVVLMTIHQSKGLEWDAVAVVGMADGRFPSGQGGLSITPDERHPGGADGDVWTPPEYHATVPTWLDDPSSVPVPVRVDAGILPRFPHDAEPGGDATDALRMLDDVEVIDDEIYGDLRAADLGDETDAVDPDSWYLTQQEEYGRRLLADERRLAYVALTRARRDALLTYSVYASADRDPRPLFADGKPRGARKPSVFWTEVHDALAGHAGAIGVGGGDGMPDGPSGMGGGDAGQPAARESGAAGEPETLASIGADRPEGFFMGEAAESYAHAVVDDAWDAPLEPHAADTAALVWPAALSAEVRAKLGVESTPPAPLRPLRGQLPSPRGAALQESTPLSQRS
ncbi:ATP-dependent DNA helicase [Bifidobacterium ramosum]|uniref:DNA 3'-5' helicase n=1 Tax=Bifidobacterium ramosum TaxID=1798158 RepID=A0A6L4WZZ4_9BIFI